MKTTDVEAAPAKSSHPFPGSRPWLIFDNCNISPEELPSHAASSGIGSAMAQPAMLPRSPPKFRIAIRDEDASSIASLLRSTPNVHVNACDANGETPLHIAVRLRNVTIVEMLLERNANPNSTSYACTDFGGYTPLHYACESGSNRIVKLLLSKNASVNCISKSGLSPLLIAVIAGHGKIVKILLEHGATVNYTSDSSTLDHPRPYAWSGYSALHVAVLKCYRLIVKLLVRFGADIHARGRNDNLTPLQIAIKHGQDMITESYAYLKNSSSTNCSRNKACFNKIKRYTDLVRTLINFGSKIDETDVSFVRVMHEAIGISSCPSIIQVVINSRREANQCSWSFKNNRTLLHTAVGKNRYEITEILLNSGANINATDATRKTPLFYGLLADEFDCTMPDWLKMIEMLLSRGARIDVADETFVTPFCCAVTRGQRMIAAMFLRHPDCPIKGSAVGTITPLHRVAHNGDIVIATMLLNRGADIDATIRPKFAKIFGNGIKAGYTPLHIAVKKGHKDFVTFLLDRGAAPDPWSRYTPRTPLRMAMAMGYVEIVRCLMNRGAGVNPMTPGAVPDIVRSAEWGQATIVESMSKACPLAANARKSNGCSVLHCALRKKQFEVAKVLMMNGANVTIPDERGRFALNIVIERGPPRVNRQLELVELMIEKGADVNVRDSKGMTPILVALHTGHLTIVKLLLDRGARVDVDHPFLPIIIGETAAKRGRADVLDALLAHVPDVNFLQTTGNRRNVFEQAVYNGNVPVVQVLLKHGWNPNVIRPEAKEYPIHVAVRTGRTITQILIHHGARVNVFDSANRTPLHVACDNNFASTIECLLKNGADVNLDHPDPSKKLGGDSTFFGARVNANLRRHVVKLKIAKLYVSQRRQSELILGTPWEHEILSQVYQKEIDSMKKTKLRDTVITYYDVLRGLYSYDACNPSIIKAMKYGKHKKMFPMYGHLIECSYRRAIRIEPTMESGRQSLARLAGFVLPTLVMTKILGYLTDHELSTFVEATKINDER